MCRVRVSPGPQRGLTSIKRRPRSGLLVLGRFPGRSLRSDATLGWSSPWGGLPEVIPWSSVLAREVVPENAAGVLVLMAVDAKRGGCRP